MFPTTHLPHLLGKLIQIDGSVFNGTGQIRVFLDDGLHVFPVNVPLGQFRIAQGIQSLVRCETAFYKVEQLFRCHTSAFQRTVEGSSLFNILVGQPSAVHQHLFQHVAVSIGNTAHVTGGHQLVQAGVKGRPEPVVPGISASRENIPQVIRHVRPELLGLVITAKDDLKGLQPF